MPNQSVELNQVFQGLSDPTRRAVVARLCSGPASVGELARPFQMALPSFTQHLGVLEDCGLVKSRKVGRVRTYELSPARLKLAQGWLEQQRSIWENRLNSLDSYLKQLNQKRSKEQYQ